MNTAHHLSNDNLGLVLHTRRDMAQKLTGRDLKAIPIHHRWALKQSAYWRKLMPNSDPPLMGDLFRFGEIAKKRMKDIIEYLAKNDYKKGASDERLHARCGQLAETVGRSQRRADSRRK